jgi:hypothetical protein
MQIRNCHSDILKFVLKMYKSGHWKPDRESALRLYEYLKSENMIPEETENKIRLHVTDDMAAKLFIVKEVLDSQK